MEEEEIYGNIVSCPCGGFHKNIRNQKIRHSKTKKHKVYEGSLKK